MCILITNFINYNKINTKIFSPRLNEHLGSIFDNMYMISLLSYLFSNEYIIDFDFYITNHDMDRDTYLQIPNEQKTPNEIKNLSELPKHILENNIGILLLSFDGLTRGGHETAVITCNSKNKWYNNHNPMYEGDKIYTMQNYEWKDIFSNKDTILRNLKFKKKESGPLTIDTVENTYDYLYLRYIIPIFKNNVVDIDFNNLELDDKNTLVNTKLKEYINSKIDFYRYIILEYNLPPKYRNLYKYILRNDKLTHTTRVFFPLKIEVGGFVYNTLLLKTLKYIVEHNEVDLFNYILDKNKDYILNVIKEFGNINKHVDVFVIKDKIYKETTGTEIREAILKYLPPPKSTPSPKSFDFFLDLPPPEPFDLSFLKDLPPPKSTPSLKPFNSDFFKDIF